MNIKPSERPISSKPTKLQNAINQIMDQQEPQDLLHKITNLWANKPATEHDQNIMFQRCLYILQLDPEERTLSQARQVQSYFEKQFHYIGQIRGQLSPELYLKLFKNLLLEKVNKFEMVFKYGEKGKKMYFLLEGEIGILIPQGEDSNEQKDLQSIKRFEDLLRVNYGNYKLVAVKKKGDHFGEIAIEQRVPRTATVVAKCECILATLSYDAYQSVLGLLQEQIMKRKLEIIQHIPPFKNWVHAAQYVFLHNCEEITFETNNLIYKRFHKGDSIYIILEGEVLVQKWEQFRLDGEDEIFIPHERVSTLGLYSRGQIVGDYEIYLSKMQHTFVKRCSQAKCMVATHVLKVPIQQYIENMKNNQTDEWLDMYYEQKFNKKWINFQFQLSLSPKPRSQYVLSDQPERSHLLRKISCHKNEQSYRQEENESSQASQVMTYSQQLLKVQKQNRKYLINGGSRKTSLSTISTTALVKNLKDKIENYKDKFSYLTGIQSFSIQSRSCKSRSGVEVNSFSTQLKPSTCCSKQKQRIRFNSFHRIDQLFKFQKK